MRIRFLGGVRNVTGSKHLIETDKTRLLIDCGLFQGHRRETYEKNRNLPFDVRLVNAMVLGHAHIDHSGNIPNLVRLGYKGPIYATKATVHISQYMLLDSAYLQEKDAEFVNKKNLKKGLQIIEPLYTIHDALDSLRNFVPKNYNKPFKVGDDLEVNFIDAGHILGSALTIVKYKHNSKEIRLGYIVDLGRKGLPLLRSPVVAENLDYMIIESTYGNRVHAPISGAKEKLKNTLIKTYDKGGKLIIPSFALERTQEILFYLHKLYTENGIPQLPIYVDSPLAINLTSIYAEHIDCLDRKSRKIFLEGDDPFGFKLVRYTRTTDESKALNTEVGSCVIISASGMAEGGRILHHLKNNISDPRNTIMIVGFMAENTLG
ncbi:MAG: MBL fold metallo-hydrolase, partial [bacterium]